VARKNQKNQAAQPAATSVIDIRRAFTPRAAPPFEDVADDNERIGLQQVWVSAERMRALGEMWVFIIMTAESDEGLSEAERIDLRQASPELPDPGPFLDLCRVRPDDGGRKFVHAAKPARLLGPIAAAMTFLDAVAAELRRHVVDLSPVIAHEPTRRRLADVREISAEELLGVHLVLAPCQPVRVQFAAPKALAGLIDAIRPFLRLLSTSPMQAVHQTVTRFGPDTRKGVVVSQAALDRVGANTDRNLISLDGTDYPVKAEVAAFFCALIEYKGTLVAFQDLEKQYPVLKNKRPNRLYPKLPEPIQNLVEAMPGGGCRLRVEALEGTAPRGP
jgi:hypothetical protein